MNKITVSAPGKLMLLGEHAVVHNHPCLVTAVDKRIYTTVEIIDKNEFRLEAKDVGIVGYKKPMAKIGKGDIPKGALFVETAIKNTLELFLCHSGKRSPAPDGAGRSTSRISYRSNQRDSGQARMTVGVRVTTKSEFSPKLGFGSSSAVTVCVVKTISEIFNLKLSKKEIFDISYKTVLDIQDIGSGFDVAAAVYGGTLYFVTGGKVIESLNIKELPLTVGYSGIKTATVEIINEVKSSFVGRQNRLEGIYNCIETLVNKAKDALVKSDWVTLGNLMNKNQDYLSELGVSSDKLDDMIKAAIDNGAYGAKLSGAGGGDCMIAICSEDKKQAVKDAIDRVCGEIINVETGAEGVRIE